MNDKIHITPQTWQSLQLQMVDRIMFNAFTNSKLNKQHASLKRIYHYTSLSNLISIVENQSIFFTNIYFLNDKKEYKYGVDLLLNRVDELKNQGLNSDILNLVSSHINLIFKSERFVSCFSKNGDLLSQWRAYANHGKGISIGFESMMFERRMSHILRGKHIVYDKTEQIETIDELLKIVISFFEEYKDIFDWSEYGYEWLVANAIIEFMNDIISMYKDPSFFEEQEYRLEYNIDGNMVKKSDEEIHFRATETQIIPYVKLISEHKEVQIDLQNGKYDNVNTESYDPLFLKAKLPIKEIIIGPSLDYEMTKMGIEELLEKNGYKYVDIIKSNIPYRL